MAKGFQQPVRSAIAQDQFGLNEPGLVHPRRPSFVRLHDNGDIELTAGETLSILMAPSNRTITFVADQVKFLTKDDGFRWNRLSFNKDAWQFNQPTFHQLDDSDAHSLYRGVDVFLQGNTTPDAVTSLPNASDIINE